MGKNKICRKEVSVQFLNFRCKAIVQYFVSAIVAWHQQFSGMEQSVLAAVFAYDIEG